jgi:hypothetical protein
LRRQPQAAAAKLKLRNRFALCLINDWKNNSLVCTPRRFRQAAEVNDALPRNIHSAASLTADKAKLKLRYRLLPSKQIDDE